MVWANVMGVRALPPSTHLIQQHFVKKIILGVNTIHVNNSETRALKFALAEAITSSEKSTHAIDFGNAALDTDGGHDGLGAAAMRLLCSYKSLSNRGHKVSRPMRHIVTWCCGVWMQVSRLHLEIVFNSPSRLPPQHCDESKRRGSAKGHDKACRRCCQAILGVHQHVDDGKAGLLTTGSHSKTLVATRLTRWHDGKRAQALRDTHTHTDADTLTLRTHTISDTQTLRQFSALRVRSIHDLHMAGKAPTCEDSFP